MSKSKCVGAAIAATLLLAALPVRAQSDPVTLLAEQMAGPGTFFLNNSESRDVVHYSHKRDLEVCVPSKPKPSPTLHPAIEIPVKLTWDGGTATVFPGNCFYFDAKEVTVSPGAPLPQDEILTGHIRPR